MLDCSCTEYDGLPDAWGYFAPEDFTCFESKRRKRCSSCNQLIEIGSNCLRFERVRPPYTEVEEKICGEDVPMPPLHMCEQCGEIYLNLSAVGYCMSPTDDMRECMSLYHKLTRFKPVS